MEINGNMNMDVNMNKLGHHHHIDHYNINCNGSIVSIGQNDNDHLAMCDIWKTTPSAATNNSNATDHSNNLFYSAAEVTLAATGSEEDTSCHPFLLVHPLQQQQQQERLQLSNMNIYGGSGSHYPPDPHLMCLNLGKRHYFEDNAHVPPELLDERHVGGFPVGMMMMMMSKRDNAAAAAARLYGAGVLSGPNLARKVVPRCQVEGCHVALLNSKDYHRRHKVCEMHSKASKVTVLGRPHRFCQQCSKFQLLSEFDQSKRSCRRRLAGHNERRRRSPRDSQEHKAIGGRKFQYLSSPTRRALSFLSSRTRYDSWVSPSDLSSRSGAALRELIVENRAAILARELLISSSPSSSSSSSTNINYWGSSSSSHNNNVHAITEDLFADYGQDWSNSIDGQPWSNSIDGFNHHHHHHQMFPDQNNYQHG